MTGSVVNVRRRVQANMKMLLGRYVVRLPDDLLPCSEI